jgi:hypothetical protein
MSVIARDHRPKVISISNRMDGLQIAAWENILWPCHAFSISIPAKKRSSLNVFEKTILKITEIESGDTAQIAHLARLEFELVRFVQNRLNHLGLLTDRYELSELGQELLNEWQNNSDGILEYTVATMFVDLMSGKLLPYVSTQPLNYKKIDRLYSREDPEKKGEYENFVNFFINPTKEKSKNTARQIRPSRDSCWNAIPNATDIIRAIRDFKIRYKRYSLLNPGIGQYPPVVPSGEAISVNQIPDLVYLHCKALIQVGNPDILVTDGCGFGFSESFASYIASQDWQWVIDLRTKGVIDVLDSDQSNEESGDDSPLPDGLKKYPQIAHPLRRARRYLTESGMIDVNSSNDEQEFVRLTGLTVVALYEAIEWALRFVVSDNPAVQWEYLFSSQSYMANDKILCSFATKIGFDVPVNLKTLLQVIPGKIKAFYRGESEMQPLLALAIAGAINDPIHPLHNLAVKDSGSLSFISILKEVRDPVSHGRSKDVELSMETLKRYCDRAVQLIRAIIPDISEESYTSSMNLRRDIDQERLKARIDLDSTLGLGFVRSIPPTLREELIKLTILNQRRNLGREQIQRCINLMASIMQMSLFEFGEGRRLFIEDTKSIKDEALQKIVQSGFYPSLDAIPIQIRTVNVKRFQRTIQGTSTTLGAQILEVFLLGSESELTQIQKSDPSFIEFVAELIRLRGHGNKQQRDFSSDKVKLMKNDVFKRIKILREV